MRNRILQFAALAALVLLAACGGSGSGQGGWKDDYTDSSKPISLGKPNDIFVFADPSVYALLKDRAPLQLGINIATVRPESLFTVHWVPFDQLEKYWNYDNILILGDYSANTPLTAFLNNTLGTDIAAQVARDGAVYAEKSNLWTRDQMAVFVLGKNPQAVEKLFTTMGGKIVLAYRGRLYQRVAAKVYARPSYGAETFSGLPFTLDLPVSYVPCKTLPQKQIWSWLNRHDDLRRDLYITVSRTNMPAVLDSTWLVSMRDSLAAAAYEGDVADKAGLDKGWTEIAGKRVYRIGGRWQNDKYYTGGAFVTLAWPEPGTRQLWIIDGAVFDPDNDKLNDIIELEIIASTLKPQVQESAK